VRLAWFRPSTFARDTAPLAHASSSDEATAALIAELRARHDLDVYTRANAHDFVWIHFRAPYELCVFELDNSASHAFIWPYLLHYGGVLLLLSPTLHDARARALTEAGRRDDYTAEFLFGEGHAPPRVRTAPWMRPGSWPMLRAPMAAARVTVVPYRSLADVLREQYPETRIVYAPLGVRPGEAMGPRPAPAGTAVTFAVLAGDRVNVARLALARAHEAGANAALRVEASADRLLHEADVILALSWPPHGEGQQLARAAMAAGTPLVTLETILTADWPALDPQTWQPRGMLTHAPGAVTVDLRDEEHSLALAIRRLSADAALRSQLGDAARAWSRAHESVDAAVGAWQRLLQEAVRLDPPPRPADWPPHLAADGTEYARAMLAEFGVTVDLF
jgi:hypothetical protein